MPPKQDHSRLSGMEKAAVLLLAVGKEQCTRLLSMMHEDEVKGISLAIAQLGNIQANVVEALCDEFVRDFGRQGALIGSFDATEQLLLAAMPPEKAAAIMDEIRGPAGRTMWDKLGNVNESVLASYLKNEYPQTVAVVLSKVKPDHAGRVLTLLPENFAIEVVMRMLRMESVQREVLDGVERTLRSEFMTNLSRSSRRDSHEMMAEIFNSLDRQAEGRFVSALEDRNRESADRIKALMFTFEDLRRLSSPHIQILLRTVPKDKLPLALKGGSETVKQLFFGNLSERAGRMLQEEIDGLGPVKLRDVDEAQASIVAAAKQLASTGEIEISESGGGDEMVD